MRSFVALISLAGAAHAQPSEVAPTPPMSPIDHRPTTTVAASLALSSDIYIAGGIDVRVGYRLNHRYYLDVGALAAGAFDPHYTGGGSLYGLRAGVSYVYCGPVGCRGLGITSGFETARVGGTEALYDPPEWSSSRKAIVLEGRGLLRARLGQLLALELAGGLRANTRLDGAHALLGIGLELSLGLVATL